MSKFQIIATIGPASRNLAVIKKLIQSGMTMARLSFLHDTLSEHARTVSVVREACDQLGGHVPILQDLRGPKLRVARGYVKLARGQTVTLIPDTQVSDFKGDAPYISLTDEIHQHVKEGDLVLINNGVIQLVVKEVCNLSTMCKVKHGGIVKAEKGVNLPMTDLPTKAFTEKDKEDLAFCFQHQLEWVALSFVESASDIIELREWIQKQNPERMPLVMSKIETRAAIENLRDIAEVSDTVMVARGDMALEISFAKLPLLQKRIISECRSLGKPVIVATGFMDSMCQRCVPSRAEVMDVANAFLDGATGILLSQETAVGRYPVETVSMVSSILAEINKDNLDEQTNIIS